MRLSTMTNLCYTPQADGRSYIHALHRAYDAGYRVMDFNMCPMQRGEGELVGDDWQSFVYEIADEAAKLGIEFSQSHLPYAKVPARRKSNTDPGCERNEFFVKMTERAVAISAMLGVKWAVVHPVQLGLDPSLENDVRYNHEIYDGYLETASRSGVGLAFENMADLEAPHRRFGVTAEDLIALVKSYNSPYVGICWDFGHANRVYADQCVPLRAVVPLLRATHLDDNLGRDDLHTLPFFGSVNWRGVMKVLREGSYAGDLTYELSIYRRMPGELMPSTIEYARKIGEYLLTL